MRILVDSSNYLVDNDNLGDRSIFQVLGRRLLGLWPEAQIRFITGNCSLIKHTHPGLQPVVLRARLWMEDGPDLESYITEVEAADLVIATGGGYYSDAFAAHAEGVLDTLDAACQLGKPAVMMSAGFEPVQDEALLELAQWVLPRLALIACREGVTGPAYLRSLGVQPGRVVVTGDDSVELAYEARRAELGDAIGVNMRQAPYAGVDDMCISLLRSVLADARKRHQAPLLSVPISLYGPSDLESIAKLLGPAGQARRAVQTNTPQRVLEQVSRCRLMVTGSYHAAVFALSQGIPVVGITDSLHYRTKLSGLAHQFGVACTLLAVHDRLFGEKVAEAIDRLWARADEFRPALLAAAADQIAAGQAAYARLPWLLRARDGATGSIPAPAQPYASATFQPPRGQIEVFQTMYRQSPTFGQLTDHTGRPSPAGFQAPGSVKGSLSAPSRERDVLRRICDQRADVINTLVQTCEMRQREIEAITSEARLREEIIRGQVAALANMQRALEERTAWAERMVMEAEQRGDVIAELRAAMEEREATAKRLIEEAERREAVLMNTCDVRQREIEQITAEARRRDDVIWEQVVALADMRKALNERTAWDERAGLGAERREVRISELEAILTAAKKAGASRRLNLALVLLRAVVRALFAH